MTGIAAFLFWASLVVFLLCFVLVLVAIYQNGSPTFAIVCAASSLLVAGFLLAFIYGWIKSPEWGITKIMLLWTIVFLVGLICYYIAPLPFTRSDLPDM